MAKKQQSDLGHGKQLGGFCKLIFKSSLTRDLQLRLCCDGTDRDEQCVFQTDKGIRRGTRRWLEHTAICPQGTKKVGRNFDPISSFVDHIRMPEFGQIPRSLWSGQHPIGKRLLSIRRHIFDGAKQTALILLQDIRDNYCHHTVVSYHRFSTLLFFQMIKKNKDIHHFPRFFIKSQKFT